MNHLGLDRVFLSLDPSAYCSHAWGACTPYIGRQLEITGAKSIVKSGRHGPRAPALIERDQFVRVEIGMSAVEDYNQQMEIKGGGKGVKAPSVMCWV